MFELYQIEEKRKLPFPFPLCSLGFITIFVLFFTPFANETALCLLWCRVRRLSFLGGADGSAEGLPLTRRGRDRWRLLGMVSVFLLVRYSRIQYIVGKFGWLLCRIFEIGRGRDMNYVLKN